MLAKLLEYLISELKFSKNQGLKIEMIGACPKPSLSPGRTLGHLVDLIDYTSVDSREGGIILFGGGVNYIAFELRLEGVVNGWKGT